MDLSVLQLIAGHRQVCGLRREDLFDYTSGRIERLSRFFLVDALAVEKLVSVLPDHMRDLRHAIIQ